jgi:hypothetical protein
MRRLRRSRGRFKRFDFADGPRFVLFHLLRWDLVAQPGTTGEKAQIITYQFKLAYDCQVVISDQKTGGLMESPIGGMVGMGGAFGVDPAVYDTGSARDIVSVSRR